LELAVVPIVLGRGERLFENLEKAAGDYHAAELACSPRVAHIRLVKGAAG